MLKHKFGSVRPSVLTLSVLTLSFPQYQQQRVAQWQTLVSQWRVWPVVLLAVVLVALIPYTVYRMLTAFNNPPPHILFNMAAICFGILSEILLLR